MKHELVAALILVAAGVACHAADDAAKASTRVYAFKAFLDGKPASVRLVKTGDANEITTPAGSKSESGCLMTYAYWNPALRDQKRLLDPQTGQVDAVTVERAGSGSIPVGGRDVAATDWRIGGGESPIDLWISDQDDWVGLDAGVGNGRHKLSYRLP